MITSTDIQATHDRIRPHIHRTPILSNETINSLIGASIYFKCENFQKTGSFKTRGAFNAVLQITALNKPSSFVTHSAGNHAQAVAYAAAKFGIPSYVVMPETAPEIKKEAVRTYGAKVVECAPTMIAREDSVKKIIEKTGATFIHPFDDDMVISGQATAAKELFEDSEQYLDCIVVPISGGGLISGASLATHYFSPSTLIYGAEPQGAPDALHSFQTGTVQIGGAHKSIADGLLAYLSERTLNHIRNHVKDIFLVSEEEIIEAMKLVWERMKIIIEPSSAVPLAAIIKRKDLFAGQKVGIIISGGNVDLSSLIFRNS